MILEALVIKNYLQRLATRSHCHAQSLDLACGDSIRNAVVFSKSLDASCEIAKLVKFSPKYDSHNLRRKVLRA